MFFILVSMSKGIAGAGIVIFEILNIKISLKAARNGEDPSWFFFFFFQYFNIFFEMTLLIICP